MRILVPHASTSLFICAQLLRFLSVSYSAATYSDSEVYRLRVTSLNTQSSDRPLPIGVLLLRHALTLPVSALKPGVGRNTGLRGVCEYFLTVLHL